MMNVAPERLLMTLSLNQVAELIVAWEDATMSPSEDVPASERETLAPVSGVTVRAPAAHGR